jgi:hypothetical protein
MAAFYIRTVQGSIGPFTGIELREAAFAGVVCPTSEIGPGPKGPWTRASSTGLFNELGGALPHPDGTVVARYHIRGLRQFSRGPLRLRDLIVLSVRRQIHDDAQLQSDLSGNWIPIQRIHILRACLLGELHFPATKHGSPGDTFHLAVNQSDRHDSGCFDREPESDFDGEVSLAPPEGHSNADQRHNADLNEKVAAVVSENPPPRTNSKSEYSETPKPEPQRSISEDSAAPDSAAPDSAIGDESEDEPVSEIERTINEHLEQLNRPTLLGNPTAIEKRIPLREQIAKHRKQILRTTIAFVAVALLSLFGWYFFFRGTQLSQVMGNWVNDGGTIGLRITDDGHCLAFNTSGQSWTGSFNWIQRSKGASGIEFIQPAEPIAGMMGPNLDQLPYRYRDARIGWNCPKDQVTVIGNHIVFESFLRRSGNELMAGFLTGNHRNTDSALANWIRFQRESVPESDIVSDLAFCEVEPPIDLASRQLPHLSRAISLLMAAQDGSAKDASMTEKAAMINHGCLCYSSHVNAKYLLANYGIPDEAKALTESEIALFPEAPDFRGSQQVRYDSLVLILDAEGIVRHCSLR